MGILYIQIHVRIAMHAAQRSETKRSSPAYDSSQIQIPLREQAVKYRRLLNDRRCFSQVLAGYIAVVVEEAKQEFQ